MDEKQKVIVEEIKRLESNLKSLKGVSVKPLELKESGKSDSMIGVRSDGKTYSVRNNRDRYFFPNEWEKFYDALKDSQKLTFDVLINSGSRINEAIHIKVGDVALQERRIILRVTKVKAKKREKNPRPRTIRVSTAFSRRLGKYMRAKGIYNKNDDYLGLLSKPATHIAMKKALQKANIKDWHMFSTHNIRKTHGNWLKALGVDGAEICSRLGHDYNTYLKAYASASVFTTQEINKIRDLLGDLYH